MAENEEDSKIHKASRYDLLYKTHIAYAKKKSMKKEVLEEAENKECTHRPVLFKSKVKPNTELSYSVYQKKPALPKEEQEWD